MNYQKLFNYLKEQHGIMLLQQDMQEIVNLVNEMKQTDINPRYFKIQTYIGGQSQSPILIKGKNYTEALCEFRIKNPYYMNRPVDLISEINEG